MMLLFHFLNVILFGICDWTTLLEDKQRFKCGGVIMEWFNIISKPVLIYLEPNSHFIFSKLHLKDTISAKPCLFAG